MKGGCVMDDIKKIFYNYGIIPVIKIDDAKDAAPLARALCEGGLPVAEVTFRTAGAEHAIKNMVAECPDMLVGAGTVLNTRQVDLAMAAGARFMVSPGLNPNVVRHCVDRGIAVIPGTSSPTDIEMAMELGLDVVKFFPAEASGGIAKIKAMAAPYTGIRFVPTGGINAANLKSYLDFPRVLACGGSWMVTDGLVNEGNFDKVRALTREAVSTMLGFEIRHVGINMANEQEADSVAGAFERMFGFTRKTGNLSIFAGTAIEVMKSPYLGTHGHIAISTNYIERAVFHMELQGFEFDKDTARYDNGKMTIMYLKGEFGGYAVHLSQK